MKKWIIIGASLVFVLIINVLYLAGYFGSSKDYAFDSNPDGSNIIERWETTPKELAFSKDEIRDLNILGNNTHEFQPILSCTGIDRAYNTGSDLIFAADCFLRRYATPETKRKENRECFGGCGADFSIDLAPQKNIFSYNLPSKKLTKIAPLASNFIYNKDYYFFSEYILENGEIVGDRAIALDKQGNRTMLFERVGSQTSSRFQLLDATIENDTIYYLKRETHSPVNNEPFFQRDELHAYNLLTKKDDILWSNYHDKDGEELAYMVWKAEENIELLTSPDSEFYPKTNFKIYSLDKDSKQLSLLREFKQSIPDDASAGTEVRDVLSTNYPITKTDRDIFKHISFPEWQVQWPLFDSTTTVWQYKPVPASDLKAMEMTNQRIKQNSSVVLTEAY